MAAPPPTRKLLEEHLLCTAFPCKVQELEGDLGWGISKLMGGCSWKHNPETGTPTALPGACGGMQV